MKHSGSKNRTHVKNTHYGWTAATIGLLLVLIVPVLSIVANIWNGPGESWDHIVTYLLPSYSYNTLLLILGSGIAATVLGVFPAYIVSTREFAGSKVLEWLLVLPLAVPNYITAYAYAGFFENGGSLHRAFDIYIDMMNTPGLIVVLATSLYPYVYLSARTFFSESIQSQLQASRLLGYNGWQTFRKVALPLARPAIAAGLLLVLMEVVSDYGASHYFGVQTFSTAIFRSWFSLGEPQTALFLSAILCVLVLLLIAGERTIRGRKKFSFRHSTLRTHAKLHKGWSALISVAVCGVPVVAGFFLPVGQMLWWALTHGISVESDLISATVQSVLIAASASVIAIAAALCVVFFTRWSANKTVNTLSKAALLGYSLPAVVIAVGIMTATIGPEKEIVLWLRSNGFPDANFFINNSLLGLLFAYVVRFLAVSYGPIEAAEQRQGDTLAKVSRTLGYANVATAVKVQIPILKRSALVAGLLVFVDVMKELPITLMTRPFGWDTLAVRVFQLTTEGEWQRAALPALAIVLAGLVPVVILSRRND